MTEPLDLDAIENAMQPMCDSEKEIYSLDHIGDLIAEVRRLQAELLASEDLLDRLRKNHIASSYGWLTPR